MRNIGYPLEFTELNDVVMRDGVVGYFDFVMCLGELVDSKNIEKIRGGIRIDLKDKPEAVICTCNGKPKAVYEYCNLHGLWKTEL